MGKPELNRKSMKTFHVYGLEELIFNCATIQRNLQIQWNTYWNARHLLIRKPEKKIFVTLDKAFYGSRNDPGCPK